MPVFVAKYNEAQSDPSPAVDFMLGTIKVPKNLNLLSERLPKSNYRTRDPDEKEEEKAPLPTINEDEKPPPFSNIPIKVRSDRAP